MKKLVFLMLFMSLSSFADSKIQGHWLSDGFLFGTGSVGSIAFKLDDQFNFTMYTIQSIETDDPSITVNGNPIAIIRYQGKVTIHQDYQAITFRQKVKRKNCKLGNHTYNFYFENPRAGNMLSLEDQEGITDVLRVSEEEWKELDTQMDNPNVIDC